MMMISTCQPYFAPFPGFFYKAFHSDILVILDDVQFPRGTTWMSRNRFKNDQGTLWLTIPVWKKGLGLQPINRVRICHEGRWAKKNLESLKTAYKNAPFFEDHLELAEQIFTVKYEPLIDVNMKIIRYLMKALNIETKIVLQSDLNCSTKGPHLMIEICNKLKADHLLFQRSAQSHIDGEIFKKYGIQIKFLKIPSPVYPQLWGDFIPSLSLFDLIFNCGSKSREILFGR